MFDEIKKYKNNGLFFFKKGDKLKHVSKSSHTHCQATQANIINKTCQRVGLPQDTD